MLASFYLFDARKVDGDIEKFRSQVEILCGGAETNIVRNTVEVRGYHVPAVKTWLYGLGM